MFFVIIRLAFGMLVFGMCFFLIKKSQLIHKRKWCFVSFLTTVILITVSALIPLENVFITFSSPESAYHYNHFGNVRMVVHGKRTDFVVGEQNDTNIYAIVPKSDSGWKLGMGLDTKRIVQTISDRVTIYVYQYKNTNDYYITALDTSGGSLEITDRYGAKFQCLETVNSTLNKIFYTYYASINNFDDQYTLNVNGNMIIVKN